MPYLGVSSLTHRAGSQTKKSVMQKDQEYITRGGVYNHAVLLYPANAKVAWVI